MKSKSKNYTVNIKLEPQPDISERLRKLYDKLLSDKPDENGDQLVTLQGNLGKILKH